MDLTSKYSINHTEFSSETANFLQNPFQTVRKYECQKSPGGRKSLLPPVFEIKTI